MNYDPKTKSWLVKTPELERAYHSLIYTLRHVRILAGLPLDRYEQSGPLTDADHAQRGILDAASSIGLEMGGEWGNEIDLRTDDEINTDLADREAVRVEDSL